MPSRSPVREAKKAVFGKSSSALLPIMKRGSPKRSTS